LLLNRSFFSNGSFSVVFPYMAEPWPTQLRASGFGLVYGCSNLAKFIGPAGLAVIAGASSLVAPKGSATQATSFQTISHREASPTLPRLTGAEGAFGDHGKGCRRSGITGQGLPGWRARLPV
jgi:hypothetical protein